MNMLDNMDAITTSVSICILGCGLYMLGADNYQDVFTTLLIAGVMATLLGFLVFNWHPAKMYMGDTGSQFLGVFLAAIAVKLFWDFKDSAERGFQIRQFLIPLLAFIVPIIDTTTVSMRRIARGHSPFRGGADHTTHHLAYLGFSVPGVGLVLIITSLVSILFIHLLKTRAAWDFRYSYLIIGYFLVLFLVMQFLYDMGGRKKVDNDE
jgi:UDP-GlcNAc:undecaprenyl-phosphate GlcNAc-1-phosphate transferase